MIQTKNQEDLSDLAKVTKARMQTNTLLDSNICVLLHPSTTPEQVKFSMKEETHMVCLISLASNLNVQIQTFWWSQAFECQDSDRLMISSPQAADGLGFVKPW